MREFWKTIKTRSQRIYQKKARKCFYNHQDSAFHQASLADHLILPKYNDVGEMIDDHINQWKEGEPKYLLDVIKRLRYLARHGIPLQGLENNDNLTQVLYLLKKTIT